ncbi:hypothetical protein B0H13DRAFT_2084250 [Mycena leptocephala]|nr:hypothetical protein B0H13DRAFT_2084250 [Mycena leptocephala]
METRLLLNQMDSSVYPVLTLPPEITSEIFVHCLPGLQHVVNTNAAPLLLMRVCRTWRKIATSTPALWTTFYVDERTPVSFTRLAEIAGSWFKRAGKCPLSVKILGYLTTEGNVAMLETLRRHSRDIYSLELHTDMEDLERMSMDVPLDLVLLRKLSILFTGDTLDAHDCIEIFGNSPRLHEVLFVAAPPSFFALPWQQLTKFTGELYTVSHCMEALRLMPNITECAFSACRPEHFDTDGLAVFAHPNIEHLTLFESTSYHNLYPDIGWPATSANILGILSLPALQTLKILGVYFRTEALDIFLMRSSAPLQKLSIRPPDSQRWGIQLEWSSTFRALGITDFEIWSSRDKFATTFMDLLSKDASFLPRLQNLSWLGCQDVDLLARMIAIVNEAGAQVTARKNLEGCAQLHDSLLPHMFRTEALLPFKELKASGMDIRIGTESESFV